MSLTVKEREAFLAECLLPGSADMLFRICELLLGDPPNPDSVILRRLGLNKGEKFRLLEQLYERVQAFATQDSGAVLLRKRHEFAVRLLSEMKFDAAEAVIQASLALAYAADDFGVMHDFYDLEDSFPEERPLVIDRVLRSETFRHQGDIMAFKNLLSKVQEVKDLPNIEHNRPVFETVKADALHRAGQGKLCAKANYLFLKTVAICHALLGEFEQMIPVQEALVAHLEAFPGSVSDAELAWVKEMATLARLLWVTKRLERFESVRLSLEHKKLESKLARAELIQWRFPFMLIVATELGDQSKGEQECKLFLDLLDNPKDQHFKRGFVSQNLCECGYFYLAAGNHQMLPKIFGRMNRLDKIDFHPRSYAMSRLIKVIYEIELSNWEDATILCSNFKRSKSLIEFEGLDQILSFLQKSIQHQLFTQDGMHSATFDSMVVALAEALKGHWILNYFNVLSWIDSKRKNLPLLTFLQQRGDSII